MSSKSNEKMDHNDSNYSNRSNQGNRRGNGRGRGGRGRGGSNKHGRRPSNSNDKKQNNTYHAGKTGNHQGNHHQNSAGYHNQQSKGIFSNINQNHNKYQNSNHGNGFQHKHKNRNQKPNYSQKVQNRSYGGGQQQGSHQQGFVSALGNPMKMPAQPATAQPSAAQVVKAQHQPIEQVKVENDLDQFKQNMFKEGGSTWADCDDSEPETIESLKNRIASLEKSVRKEKANAREIEVEFKTVKEEYEKLKAKVDKTEENAKLKDKAYDQIRKTRDKLENEKMELNAKVVKLNAEVEALKSNGSTAGQGNNSLLEEEIKTMEAEWKLEKDIWEMQKDVAEAKIQEITEDFENQLRAKDLQIEALEKKLGGMDISSEEESWLFSAKATDRSEILQTMDFNDNETCQLDAKRWDSKDSFIQEVATVFKTGKVVQDIESVLSTLQRFDLDSPEFWKLCCANLELVCSSPLLIFIDNLNGMDSQTEQLFRKFISVLAEAYDSANEKDRMVLILNSYSENVVAGEDPTGNGKTPKFHNVSSFATWNKASGQL